MGSTEGMKDCSACNGMGWVATSERATATCSVCDGHGKVHRP